MIEYALFSKQPFDLFVGYLKEQGLSPQTRQEEDCLLVILPEDLESELHDRIDTEYDRLLTLNMNLVDADEAENSGYHTAGIVVNLKDGHISYANVDPGHMARILEVLSPEDFGKVVTAIVDAVENPDPRTACQKMRDGER